MGRLGPAARGIEAMIRAGKPLQATGQTGNQRAQSAVRAADRTVPTGARDQLAQQLAADGRDPTEMEILTPELALESQQSWEDVLPSGGYSEGGLDVDAETAGYTPVSPLEPAGEVTGGGLVGMRARQAKIARDAGRRVKYVHDTPTGIGSGLRNAINRFYYGSGWKPVGGK